MSFATKRLCKELSVIQNESIEGITVINSDDIFSWKAVIDGPKDSPFEGGKYKIDIQFNDNYPVRPPAVKFTSPIFHPNIYKDGKICVDILQGEWTPTQNIRTVLLSLRSLLIDPNPFSPANREAADMFRNNKDSYHSRIKKMINQIA